MKNKQLYEAIHNHIGNGPVFSKEEENELLEKLAKGKTYKPKKKWFPETLGWGLAAAAVILILGIIGSQTGLLPLSGDGYPERLDTSLLKESEIHGLENMSDEEREYLLNKSPKSYYANSTEDALKALPFKLNLPSKLPFEGEFVVQSINDWHFESNTDGKDISIDLAAGNKEGTKTILIGASDFKRLTQDTDTLPDHNFQDVTLDKGINGRVDAQETGGQITFINKKGIEISIILHEQGASDSRNILITLANQMID